MSLKAFVVQLHNSLADAPPANLHGVGIDEVMRTRSDADSNSPGGDTSVIFTDEAKRGRTKSSAWKATMSKFCCIFSLRTIRPPYC